MNLQTFLIDLEARREPFDLPAILRLLRGAAPTAETLAPYVRFGATGYTRNLVRRTEACELLVLCWLPGQASPFHDHAGSCCGVRVVQGAIAETPVRRRGHVLRPLPEVVTPAGGAVGSRGADIHRMANRGAEPAVTLHLYSPPLRAMREYRVGEALPLTA